MNAETQSLLDQIEATKQAGATIARGLSDAQFNWQPGEGRWSIAQCLNHLNVGDTLVLPAFDRAIATGRAAGKTSVGPFRYGWLSRFMISQMEPPPFRWGLFGAGVSLGVAALALAFRKQS